MILKEFNYYLKKGTTLEEIQGSLIKKVNRWCDPFTGCVAHVFDTVLLKHWIVASDNVVGLYKLDKNILLFNDFQMIYDRLDKIEEALPKDDVKEDIIDRLDKVEENLSNNQNELNEKRDELSNQENLKEKLEQEISALDKKIEEAKARGEDTTELERQKAEKERELATVTQNIANLINEITNLEQTINNLLGQKDSIEKELEDHKPKELAAKEYVDELNDKIDNVNNNLTAIINTKASADNVVTLTGNQTITGSKTFRSPIVVPNGTATTHAVNLSQLNTKANQATTYTKTEVNNLVNAKENKNVAKGLVDALRVELNNKITTTKNEITTIIKTEGITVEGTGSVTQSGSYSSHNGDYTTVGVSGDFAIYKDGKKVFSIKNSVKVDTTCNNNNNN